MGQQPRTVDTMLIDERVTTVDSSLVPEVYNADRDQRVTTGDSNLITVDTTLIEIRGSRRGTAAS